MVSAHATQQLLHIIIRDNEAARQAMGDQMGGQQMGTPMNGQQMGWSANGYTNA